MKSNKEVKVGMDVQSCVFQITCIPLPIQFMVLGRCFLDKGGKSIHYGSLLLSVGDVDGCVEIVAIGISGVSALKMGLKFSRFPLTNITYQILQASQTPLSDTFYFVFPHTSSSLRHHTQHGWIIKIPPYNTLL